MSPKIIPVLAVALLTATAAPAQFEGVLEMKTTITDEKGVVRGGGTTTVAVSKRGSRSEVNMQMGPGMTMRLVMLKKTDSPDTVYRINDDSKSYSEISVPKPAQTSEQKEKDTWTVEKLGKEKILDYNTQHILAKPRSGPGQPMEMWIAKDFLDYETYSKLQDRRPAGGGEGLARALKDADAEGMPLKTLINTPEGKVTMEVVRTESKPLPAAVFEIPAGYTKSAAGMMDPMGGMAGPDSEARKARMDEARKRMQEQMKNMTPEQREMIEKMMKERSGAP